ncbi:MAG: outer membrane protein assembly factor BamB [Pseudomonadales bacterium]
MANPISREACTLQRCAASLLFACMMLLLGACASTPEEREQKGKPLPLPDFERRVKLELNWRRDLGKGHGSLYNRLAPGLQDGAVCAASIDGRVGCFTLDGRKNWQRKLAEKLSAGAGVAGQQVLVASTDGEVIALSLADGAERWRRDLGGEILAPPQGNDDYIVVQTADGRLVGLDAANGEQRWSHQNDEPLLTLRGTATPVLVDGTVYSGFASGKLVALDVSSGSLRWDQLVALASGTAEIERLVDVDASPHVTDDIVYATSFNGNLFAFSRESGRPIWRFPSSSYREVDEGFGHVYMVNEKGRVYSINARDGEQRWEQSALVNRELSAPVVFNGYLVVGDVQGYLHVLSQIDGSIVGRARIDSSGVRAPMRVAGEQLIVYSNDGKLAAYSLQN